MTNREQPASDAPCKHEFLQRHEYHGEIWWQCDEGCDFLFRSAAPTETLEALADRIMRIGQCHITAIHGELWKRDVEDCSLQIQSAIREAVKRERSEARRMVLEEAKWWHSKRNMRFCQKGSECCERIATLQAEAGR